MTKEESVSLILGDITPDEINTAKKTAIKLVRLTCNEYSTLENILSISPNKKQFSVIITLPSILQALIHLFYTTLTLPIKSTF